MLGIAGLVKAWGDNITVVCASTALLLLEAIAPLVFPQAASYQNLLVYSAIPLIGVWSTGLLAIRRVERCG